MTAWIDKRNMNTQEWAEMIRYQMVTNLEREQRRLEQYFTSAPNYLKSEVEVRARMRHYKLHLRIYRLMFEVDDENILNLFSEKMEAALAATKEVMKEYHLA
jgi:hypothetical protein